MRGMVLGAHQCRPVKALQREDQFKKEAFILQEVNPFPYEVKLQLLLLCCYLTSMVNNYGHGGTVKPQLTIEVKYITEFHLPFWVKEKTSAEGRYCCQQVNKSVQWVHPPPPPHPPALMRTLYREKWGLQGYTSLFLIFAQFVDFGACYNCLTEAVLTSP